MSKLVVIFKRFERFWHWAQALLIIALITTGLESHGLSQLLGFETAITIHNYSGFIWAALLVLILSSILTTGEWKPWAPYMKGVDKVTRYYLYGVFKGEEHPHHITAEDKFNPMQKMTYIGIVFCLLPLQLATGFSFFFFPELRELGFIERVDVIAIIHTFVAYALITFLVTHLYLITFGKKLSSHIKVMITGKEDITD